MKIQQILKILEEAAKKSKEYRDMAKRYNPEDFDKSLNDFVRYLRKKDSNIGKDFNLEPKPEVPRENPFKNFMDLMEKPAETNSYDFNESQETRKYYDFNLEPEIETPKEDPFKDFMDKLMEEQAPEIHFEFDNAFIEDVNLDQTIDAHYNKFDYILSEEEKEKGSIRLDPYAIAKHWKLGDKDDTGCLFHLLKNISRFGDKVGNTDQREISGFYSTLNRFCELKGYDKS